MTKEQLDKILDAAAKAVKSWPEWMQRLENRQPQPYNNCVLKEKLNNEKII